MNNIVIQTGLFILLVINVASNIFASSDIMRATASINTTMLIISIAYISVLRNLKMRD